jgi:flagellar export protein FliJ
MAAPFRLARVLRVREQIRRLRTHEAEQLATQLAAAQSQVAAVRAERDRLGVLEAEHAAAGTLTPDSLQVTRAYDGALADAERAHVAETGRLGHALDAKRAQLLRDRQEEEKYVRLAEAHRQRVREDEARESDRTLDEIAVERFRRMRKERDHGRP